MGYVIAVFIFLFTIIIVKGKARLVKKTFWEKSCADFGKSPARREITPVSGDAGQESRYT